MVFDEAGYVSGLLGHRRNLAVFLNQGRSAGLSVVAGMTRPSSVVQQLPRETLNQVRHIIIFRYRDEKDAEACGHIAGISKARMLYLMQKLRFNGPRHIGDFLYVGKNQEEIYLVRTH